MGEGLALPLPEPDLVAVGQEDIGHVELLRVVLRLLGGVGGIDGEALGLDDGQRAAVAVAQNVVGALGVGQDYLEAHGVRVLRVPALRGQLGVDLDAGEGFVLAGHSWFFWPRRSHPGGAPDGGNSDKCNREVGVVDAPRGRGGLLLLFAGRFRPLVATLLANSNT